MSQLLTRIGIDPEEHKEQTTALECLRKRVEQLESRLSETEECAALIDWVVNGSRENERNRPVCKYKMRF